MGPSLTILAYHHVDERFRAHLRILRACGRLVSVSEGLAALTRGERGHMIAVTFDDFYEQVYRHFYQEKFYETVPATAFLSTAYAGAGAPFWWDRVSLILAQTAADNVRWGLKTYLLDGAAARKRLAYTIRADLRFRHPDEIEQEVSHLQRDLGCDSPTIPDDVRPVSWPQVAEMARVGIEIGSHTETHPCLSRIGEADLMRELQASKHLIEEKLNYTVGGLAYPFGGSEYFNDKVCELARSVGYQFALTSIDGVNRPGADPFALRRYSVVMDESPLKVFIKASDWGPYLAPLKNIWRRLRGAAR
jgi:hypothetical protein